MRAYNLGTLPPALRSARPIDEVPSGLAMAPGGLYVANDFDLDMISTRFGQPSRSISLDISPAEVAAGPAGKLIISKRPEFCKVLRLDLQPQVSVCG